MRQAAAIPKTIAAASEARRLAAIRGFVTRAGWWCCGGLAVAAAAVVAARLIAGPGWWWWLPVVAALAGIGIAGAIALLGRWSITHAASFVDKSNDTESALLTAIEIDDSDGEPGLVARARARGESVATGVDPSRGIAPINAAGWWWALLVAGVCVAAGLLIDPFSSQPPRPDNAPIVQRAIEQTQLAAADAGEVEPAALPDPQAWEDTLAEIEALEDELRENGDADAAARAAAALEQAADELDEQTERDALAEQEARDRAASFEPEAESDNSGLVERLADALARNDMLEAEEAARTLDEAGDALSESERRALADTLEDLASRLEPEDGRNQTSETTPSASTQDSPTDSATDSENQPEEQRPEDAPSDESADPNESTSEQDSPSTPDQPQPADQAQTEPRPMSDALRERADQLRQSDESQQPQDNPDPAEQSRSNEEPNGSESPTDPGDESTQSDNVDPSARENEPGSEQQTQGDQPGTEQGQESSPQPDPDQPTGGEQPTQDPTDPNQQGQGEQPVEQPSQNPGDQPSERPTNSGEQQRPDPSGTTPESAPPQSEPGTQPDQQQPGERPDQQPGEQPGQQPEQQPGQPSGNQQDPQQPGQQPDRQPGPRPGDSGEPTDQGEQAPGDQQTPPAGDSQRQAGDQPGAVERAVREMRDRQSAREQNRRVAESLRERARDLIDGEGRGDPRDDTDQDNNRGAGDDDGRDPFGPGAQPDPSQFEPVDASGDTPPEPGQNDRVVGEWFDPDRTELPPTERAAARQELDKAARRARDALDNQQVPRRYRDLIRKVFDRVQKQADEPSSPAPAGKDADS